MLIQDHTYDIFLCKVCVIINCMFFSIGLGKMLSDVRWRRATARWKAAVDLYFPTRCRTPPTAKYTMSSDTKHSSSTLAQLQIWKFSTVENLTENLKRCVFSYRIVQENHEILSKIRYFLPWKIFRFAVELKLNLHVPCQKFACTYPLEACGSALKSRGP